MPPEIFANLREAHAHIYDFGDALACVDLGACRSREQLLQTIAGAEPDHTGWIRGMRAMPESWDDPAWPTHAELHDAARGSPCYARSLDIHSLCASTAALEAAGIDDSTPDPANGVIVRDESRKANGLLLELACDLVLNAVPEPTFEQRKQTVRTALERFASLGYVEVHDMLSRDWLGPACAALEKEANLACAVVLHPLFEHCRAELERYPHYASERIRFGGAKIFTDGALNSRTAFMLEPFARPRQGIERGIALWSEEKLRSAIRECEDMRLPIVAHAIGDAAVRRLFNAIDSASPKTPGTRIEHAQFVDEHDVPRFARLGVIVSPQPCHLLTDIEPILRLLPHRAHRAFPLRDLWDAYAGAGLDPARHIWFGSDAPVVPPNPQDNLQAAVHRTRAGEPGCPVIAPEQALTEAEARSLMNAR